MEAQTAINEHKAQKGRAYALIWIIPILTLMVTGWLIYNDYINSGIKITLRLNSGESIIAGKTSVKYLGVEVGKVVDIDIAKDDNHKIDLTVRLKSRAALLAVEGTTFWRVRPVLSLKKISGLETIVSGHYIAVKPPFTDLNKLAKLKKKKQFDCLDNPPEIDYSEQGKLLEFTSATKGNINTDTGIYFKDIKIGHVVSQKLDQKTGKILFSAIIYTKFEHLLNQNFYLTKTPFTSLTLDSSGVDFKVKNMDIFLYGGIELHIFNDQTPFTKPKELELYSSKQEAEETYFKYTNAKIITLYTRNPDKLMTGSPVYYKRVQVGEIKKLSLSDNGDSVFLKTVIYGKYRKLLKNKSKFWVMSNLNMQLKHKTLSIQTPPIKTLMTGAVAFYTPTIKEKKKNRRVTGYKLYSSKKEVEEYVESQREGLRVILHSSYARSLSSGDPVYFRQIKVGRVEWSKLAINAQYVLIQIFIEPTYAHLLYKGAKFWNVGILNSEFNLFGVKVQTQSLESMLHGGVAFSVPQEKRGHRAKNGDTFMLYEKPDKKWLEWRPKL